MHFIWTKSNRHWIHIVQVKHVLPSKTRCRTFPSFPQQAGTSAIPQRDEALPPFPTCAGRDDLETALLSSAMVSFAWICTAVESRKSWKQTSKTNQGPISRGRKGSFPTKKHASRSTWSAHTAVERQETTCTISTLILLEPLTVQTVH